MAAPADNEEKAPDINVTLLGWVQAANGENLRKVCIVHNKTYQVLAKTHVEVSKKCASVSVLVLDLQGSLNNDDRHIICLSVQHVPTQWKNESGDQINENQELLDDWKAKKSFNFFQTNWTIKMKDDGDGKFLVGEEEGKNVIVAREFDIYWFVAAGPLNDAKQNKGFNDYKAAYDAIMEIWQPIMDQQN